ncbi:hypothetical protein WJX77_012205 [Trebouxia sp. C0004]
MDTYDTQNKPPSALSGTGWSRSAGAILLMSMFAYLCLPGSKGPPETTPFAKPKLADLPQFGGQHAEDLLWSTFRPGQYFGMRMRTPKSLLAGLMWFNPHRPHALSNIRHNAQERDGLTKYGWEAHDGKSYGRQELYDEHFHLTTSWVKRQCNGCGNGGDWALKLDAQHLSNAQNPVEEDVQAADESQPKSRRMSVMFYIADEREQELLLEPDGWQEHAKSRLLSSGQHPIAGDWQLHVTSTSDLKKMRHLAIQTPHMHNLTECVQHSLVLKRSKGQSRGGVAYQLPNTAAPKSNVAIFQLTATLPFSMEVVFLGGQSNEQKTIRGPVNMCAGCTPEKSPKPETQPERLAALSGWRLQQLLQERETAFDKRFADTFGQLSNQDMPAGIQPVAKAALSNMLGGIGYFYGSSLISLPNRTVPNFEAALFSAVPSRSFFPRGFLWDEGFHQLLISKWDPAMSRDMLAHWLDLMNKQGWIAREQILGAEARSRVPAEYITQQPTSANPPTLFLVLAQMADEIATASADVAASVRMRDQQQFLKAAFPRMAAWLTWFNTTQAGPVPGSYRWRGRDPNSLTELNPKTLTSGLDDFPRASHPSHDERHLDLRCWMALASRALATIGKHLNLPRREVLPFEKTAELLEDIQSLKRLHFSDSTGQFLDYGNHTEAIQLQHVIHRTPQGNFRGPLQRHLVDPSQPPKLQLVPHFGYVSLFPLLMALLDPSDPELGQQLKLLKQPDLLWTPYGLRSLSLSSSIHGLYNTEHDAPYWRGPIWFNINFLALRALHKYSQAGGSHAAEAMLLYSELRTNLLSNLVRNYNESGYLWENYDEVDGHGRGSHPFSGWTALLVLVAGQTY